ncbi:MAG: Co2+/Mg2+ efflux protein ApaG [Methylophilaceae bacterium]|jgi:ApaG protein|nr:Co2+/Mg2+ efflux protein ApaG [Methylophilaceae bacterium]
MIKARHPEIEITVNTQFLEDRSLINHDRYFFAYTITIHNHGIHSIQLISRHWVIENAAGKIFEVKGDGVIGEQPIINEDESYSYTSGTEIDTPTGFMSGTYKMQSKDGKFFDAKIPKFELQMPRTLH